MLPPSETCELSTSRGSGHGELRPGWFQRVGHRTGVGENWFKKMPFMFGGGSAGRCGWNTGCHRRAVVDREKKEVMWKVPFQPDRSLWGEGAEWTGRNAQVVLPPPGLGPVTLSKLVTPPSIFAFLSAAVITEAQCIS